MGITSPRTPGPAPGAFALFPHCGSIRCSIWWFSSPVAFNPCHSHKLPQPHWDPDPRLKHPALASILDLGGGFRAGIEEGWAGRGAERGQKERASERGGQPGPPWSELFTHADVYAGRGHVGAIVEIILDRIPRVGRTLRGPHRRRRVLDDRLNSTATSSSEDYHFRVSARRERR